MVRPDDLSRSSMVRLSIPPYTWTMSTYQTFSLAIACYESKVRIAFPSCSSMVLITPNLLTLQRQNSSSPQRSRSSKCSRTTRTSHYLPTTTSRIICVASWMTSYVALLFPSVPHLSHPIPHPYIVPSHWPSSFAHHQHHPRH